jgi:hypothetical protein
MATTTTRRRPPQQRPGAPRRPSELPPPRAAAPGDSEPFSDAERKAAGQPPLELPKSDAERRKAADERAKREYKEAEAAKAADEKAHAQQVASVQSGAKSATSNLSRMLHGNAPTTVAGAAGGLFLFAMLRALLNGGPDEVRGWIAAKFINKPYQAPATTSSTSPATPATVVSMQIPASSGQPSSVLVA